MRDGHYNAGIIGGVFEAKHWKKMGESSWLFGWLVHRQTKADGKVLNGAPIRDGKINAETGYPVKQIKRWRERLIKTKYISALRTPYGTVYRVLNPKKFANRQDAKTANVGDIPVPVLDRDVPSKEDKQYTYKKKERSSSAFSMGVEKDPDDDSNLRSFLFQHFSGHRDFPELSEEHIRFAVSKIRLRATNPPGSKKYWVKSVRLFLRDFEHELRSESAGPELRAGAGPSDSEAGIRLKPEARARIKTRGVN